jgi:HEAT repeat protein
MLDTSRRLLDLMAALGSTSTEDRVRALHDIQTQGVSVVPTLVDILKRPDATMPMLVWTMMGLAHFGPAIAEQAHSALVCCLAAPSPTVRRSAIRTLAALRDESAVDAIAALRTDPALDASAWFDDDCTVAQTAELALAELSSTRQAT